MRINSQVSLMNTQRNYSMTNLLQASTMQKLASASRLGSAADDAAGMAIASKISAQLGGINMAARNTQDGISMIKTAEGALQGAQDILTRMSELATQSANGTYGKEERAMMASEFNQLRSELNDIAGQTTFNNTNLLDGSLSTGGTQRTAQTAGINVETAPRASSNVMQQAASVDSSGVAKNTVSFRNAPRIGDMFEMSGKRFEIVTPGTAPSQTGVSAVSVTEAMTSQQIAEAMAQAFAAELGSDFQFTAQDGAVNIQQLQAGVGDVSMSFTAAPQTNSTVQFDLSKLRAGDQISLTTTNSFGTQQTSTYTHQQGNSITDIQKSLGGTARGNTLTFENTQAEVEFTPTQQSGRMSIQTGALQNEQTTFDIGSLSSEALGIANLDISTQDGAGQAITGIRNALSQVSDMRGNLGAMQNRFESKVNNLSQSAISQTESYSRIHDADMAQELTRLTIQNIMQRTQTAMMAQGNTNAGNILSLLR